jgi:hypothetical protein
MEHDRALAPDIAAVAGLIESGALRADAIWREAG